MTITLRNINDFSLKEIIDFAEKKIVEQGKPSFTVTEEIEVFCQYRGPDGLKCVAGHFLSDKDYTPEMEGRSIDLVLRFLQVSVGKEAEDLLYDLQKAHDVSVISDDSDDDLAKPVSDAEFMEKFRIAINKLRMKKGLT